MGGMEKMWQERRKGEQRSGEGILEGGSKRKGEKVGRGWMRRKKE